jgi:hypothetical protein
LLAGRSADMPPHHHQHQQRCGTAEGARFWVGAARAAQLICRRAPGAQCQHDVCGWFCALITWTLLGFAWYAVNFAVLFPFMGDSYAGKVHVVCFNALIALSYWAHVKAMLTDPGAVPKEALPLDFYDDGAAQLKSSHPVCRKCQHYKPPRAHHCSVCQRCVVRMDHHCPWINNCVGAANHKFFLLFCAYVCSASVYANSLLGYRVLHCLRSQTFSASARSVQPAYCDATPGPFIMMVILAMEAILFGLFTMCMLCDQYSAVFSSMTHIERLKDPAAAVAKPGRAKTSTEHLSEVFGGDSFSAWWLLPVQAQWKARDRLFQYQFPRQQDLDGDLEAAEHLLLPADGEHGEAAAGKLEAST